MAPMEKTPLLHTTSNNRPIRPKHGRNATVIGIITALLCLVVYRFTPSTPETLAASWGPLPLFPGSRDQRWAAPQKKFTLKHIHHRGTKSIDDIHLRLDLTPQFIEKNELHTLQASENDDSWSTRKYKDQSPWTVELPSRGEQITLTRLAERHPDFVESYLDYARTEGSEAAAKITLDWNDEPVEAPNVTDKDTVISLALMSSNAYVGVPETGDWRDVKWNNSIPHGWDSNGLRGHIFVSDDNSTVVIAYKGTSAAYLSSSGDDATVAQDKDNDNLLFSCCCARVSYMWTTVCDCYKSSYTCDQRCLEKEMYKKDRYYQAALDVYRNVTSMYPEASIWTTGHSLGGSLASLIGRTYGVPAVSFEAPGELLASKRLHLPMPPGVPDYMEGIWHFGHTADPIFMGVCNGASSTCSIAGYAMETQCHSGRTCIYDVVGDKGWHVNMLNHRIHTVVDEVLEAYNETAPCLKTPPCRDCYNWNFVADDSGDNRKEDPPKATSSSSLAESPEPTKEPVCKKWTWYGRCYEWGDDGDDGDDGIPSN